MLKIRRDREHVSQVATELAQRILICYHLCSSPLVNIHAPVRVTTPEPDGPSEYEDGDKQDDDVPLENQNKAGPSKATEEEQNELEDNGTTATQPKRKRSSHEQGDVLER